jgi:hypothetical protein
VTPGRGPSGFPGHLDYKYRGRRSLFGGRYKMKKFPTSGNAAEIKNSGQIIWLLKCRHRQRCSPATARCGSGGPAYPILPRAGETSYRFLKGCPKYFCCPLKSAYEISPVKLHPGYCGPPELWRNEPTPAAAPSVCRANPYLYSGVAFCRKIRLQVEKFH